MQLTCPEGTSCRLNCLDSSCLRLRVHGTGTCTKHQCAANATVALQPGENVTAQRDFINGEGADTVIIKSGTKGTVWSVGTVLEDDAIINFEGIKVSTSGQLGVHGRLIPNENFKDVKAFTDFASCPSQPCIVNCEVPIVSGDKSGVVVSQNCEESSVPFGTECRWKREDAKVNKSMGREGSVQRARRG